MADSTAGGLPEPTEEYQKNLKKFLKDVPALPAGADEGPEIVSGTPSVPSPPGTPMTDARINAANPKSNPLFVTYTGWEHKNLLQKWKNDRTTTCNEFVGKCVAAMGYTGEQLIGRFDIADQLSSRGLSHAWVPADSGSEPEYGDVFRLYDSVPDHNGVRLNHMAMSLGVSGSDWYTVEAGQGGPGKGFDSLRRKRRDWKPSSLRGWVSMRAMLNVNKPLPFWLGGWWKVEESGDSNPYYYYFSSNGKVAYARMAPASFLVPLAQSNLVGSFTSKRMFEVEISWNSEDVNEKLTVFGDQKSRKYSFAGKTDLGTKLNAKRLMLTNAAD